MKDFTTDPSLAFLAQLKSAGAIPGYVTEAPDAEDVTGLMDVSFADTSRRLFPIHTKAAAYLSAVSAFVYGVTAEAPWIPRLKSACHAYGIDGDVQKAHGLLARKEPAPVEKEASEAPLTKYAMELVPSPDQPVQRYYPVSTADQVEDSALKLAADLAEERLPPSWFAEACENLVKAAGELGVRETLIPATVRRLGAAVYPDRSVIREEIAKRASAGLGEKALEFYEAAAEEVFKGAATPMEGAHVWEMCDRKFKLAGFSGNRAPVFAFKSGHSETYLENMKKATAVVADVLLPHAAFLSLPDRLIAGSFEEADAAKALMAKKASDGLEATRLVSGMTPASQTQLLALLCDVAV